MAEPAASESPVGSDQGRPLVIYVMGAGRSGSTIVGVTLGNCGEVFYAGELDAWLSRSGEPQLDDPRRTRFWSRVREQVAGAPELFGWEAQRAIERSISPFRVHKWRARRRLREPYRRVTENLYQAVSRVAGTPLIVDTSHYPLRARELQALDGIDLFLLYLMRDPQRVVASFNRTDVAQYSKSTLTTNVYLWLTNLLSVWVFLRQDRERRVFVRYENFVADPEGVVREILERAGVATRPPDFSALDTGVAFQGNRLIRSRTITLEREPGGTPRSSLLTTLAQLPWSAVLSRLRPAATGSAGG
jgi:Sulfotransferase family